MNTSGRHTNTARKSEFTTDNRLAAMTVIPAMLFLSFVAGSFVMYQKIAPSEALSRAFMGGTALYDKLTRYDDPFETDHWNPQRTEGRGVVRHDPQRAQQGLTLYSSGHDNSATLMDMDGRVVHEWRLPYSQVWEKGTAISHPQPDAYIYIEKAHVFPNGDLLALYTAIGDTPWGYGLVKMDRDSRIIWKYLEHAHHDFDFDADGNIYVLTQEILDDELPGGHNLKKPRIDDFIVKLSPDGKELKKFWLSGAFARSPFGRRLYFVPWFVHESSGDYLHANSVHVLKDAIPGVPRSRAGQILVSLRELSTIALADIDKDRIAWTLSGSWVRQHDAQVLDNGHVALFDNEGNPGGHGVSRVLEFDPANYAVSWSYSGREGEPLESVTRSSLNRLANGNTLIVESEAGRVFEVTPAGDIVWEFVNPVRGGTRGDRIPLIFWVERVEPRRYFTPGFLAQLTARSNPKGGDR